MAVQTSTFLSVVLPIAILLRGLSNTILIQFLPQWSVKRPKAAVYRAVYAWTFAHIYIWNSVRVTIFLSALLSHNQYSFEAYQ